MFAHIAKLIPKAIAKRGFTQPARAAWVCEKYRRAAAEIFHAEVLLHAWPKFYKNKVLTVGVDHPTYAQEVALKKHKILETINASESAAGGVSRDEKLVNDIRTVVEKPNVLEAPEEENGVQ